MISSLFHVFSFLHNFQRIRYYSNNFVKEDCSFSISLQLLNIFTASTRSTASWAQHLNPLITSSCKMLYKFYVVQKQKFQFILGYFQEQSGLAIALQVLHSFAGKYLMTRKCRIRSLYEMPKLLMLKKKKNQAQNKYAFLRNDAYIMQTNWCFDIC